MAETEEGLYHRNLLFLLGCLPTRLSIIHLTQKLSTNQLRKLSYILLLIGFSFYYIYFNKLRKTGIETNYQPIWWNHLRPQHGTFYIIAGYRAWKGNSRAHETLVIDALIGYFTFMINRHQ